MNSNPHLMRKIEAEKNLNLSKKGDVMDNSIMYLEENPKMDALDDNTVKITRKLSIT